MSVAERQAINSRTAVDEIDRQLHLLPDVDPSSAEVSLPNTQSEAEIRLRPAKVQRAKSKDGVTTADDGRGVKLIAHATSSGGGQIVAVSNEVRVRYVDFKMDMPRGYHLQFKSGGGLGILDASGREVGLVRAPWAVSDAGDPLKTSYELRTNGIIRQRFDRPSTGAVAVDPSWTWWALTVGRCALDVGPLLASGGAAIVTRIPKLISFINKLRKAKKVEAAVQRVGGVVNAAKAIVKKAVMELKSKVPSWVSNRLPKVTFTDKDKVAVAAIWGFVVDQIWDLLGFGGCAALIRGK